MCFTVLLSTDCPDDLFAQNGSGICFQPANGLWRRCVCRIRFCEPEITSLEMLERSPMRETMHLQEVVRRLVRQGWRVQLVAVWVEDWGRLQQGAEEWWRWRG